MQEILKYQDIWGILLGARRAAADLAFVQEVIYYGSPEEESEAEHEGHGKEGHVHIHFHPRKELLSHAQRVLRLDPHFHYAHSFSAAALAWVEGKPEEAIELLREAVLYRPDYLPHQLYLAVLLLKDERREPEFFPVFERLALSEGANDIVRNYYALLLEKYGHFSRARGIWSILLDSEDLFYRKKAFLHIERIEKGEVKVLTFPK